MISTINKPKATGVTRQTHDTDIDHIITNSIMHTGFKSRIIKTDISDHFPFFFCYKYIAKEEDAKKEFICKRRFSDQSIGTFKLRLRGVNWSKVTKSRNANEPYINFLTLLVHYMINASK